MASSEARPRLPYLLSSLSVLVLAGLAVGAEPTRVEDPGDRPGGGMVFVVEPGEERHFEPGTVFENDLMSCGPEGRVPLWMGAGRFMTSSNGVSVRTNEDGSVDATCPATGAQA